MNTLPTRRADALFAAVSDDGSTITMEVWALTPDPTDDWIALWWNHDSGEMREQVVADPRRANWRETTYRRMHEYDEVHQTPHVLLTWRNRRKS